MVILKTINSFSIFTRTITAKYIIPNKKSMSVKCLSDGVSVTLVGQGEPFNGIIYVKHYSSDEECRRDLIFSKDGHEIEEFKVKFGTCGLTHVNVCLQYYYA